MADAAEEPDRTQQPSRNPRAMFGAFLVALAVLFLWDSHSLSSGYTKGVGPAAIPVVMAVCLLVLSLLYLAPVLLRRPATKQLDGEPVRVAASTGHPRTAPQAFGTLRSSPATYMVLSVLFLLVITRLGFFVSLSLFLVATCAVAGVRPWWKSVAIVAGMDLFCYFGFTVGLGIYFPSGWFA